MTAHASSAHNTLRKASARTYLMCPPAFFAVNYAINPWMDPAAPVDADLAREQWARLKDTYESLGHTVHLIEPLEGLPDMVFAANGGLVIDSVAYGARFHHPERAAEGPAYTAWFTAQADAGALRAVREPVARNEGEGDFLAIGELVLAGHGFRTETDAHQEVAELFDRKVVGLELVDPRFYHLDTALAVLDDATVAYYPGAFSAESLTVLRSLFPDAIETGLADALVLGLNAVSDGQHVIVPPGAGELIEALVLRGFTPVTVDLGELLKAGGGAKCCTLEIRR